MANVGRDGRGLSKKCTGKLLHTPPSEYHSGRYRSPTLRYSRTADSRIGKLRLIRVASSTGTSRACGILYSVRPSGSGTRRLGSIIVRTTPCGRSRRISSRSKYTGSSEASHGSRSGRPSVRLVVMIARSISGPSGPGIARTPQIAEREWRVAQGAPGRGLDPGVQPRRQFRRPAARHLARAQPEPVGGQSVTNRHQHLPDDADDDPDDQHQCRRDRPEHRRPPARREGREQQHQTGGRTKERTDPEVPHRDRRHRDQPEPAPPDPGGREREQAARRGFRHEQVEQVGPPVRCGRGQPRRQALEHAEPTRGAAVFGGGGEGGGDCPRGRAADRAQPVGLRQPAHRPRVDDAAGDAALHDQVAVHRRIGRVLEPWRRRHGGPRSKAALASSPSAPARVRESDRYSRRISAANSSRSATSNLAQAR